MQSPLELFLATHPKAVRVCELQDQITQIIASNPLPLPPTAIAEVDRISGEINRLIQEGI